MANYITPTKQKQAVLHRGSHQKSSLTDTHPLEPGPRVGEFVSGAPLPSSVAQPQSQALGRPLVPCFLSPAGWPGACCVPRPLASPSSTAGTPGTGPCPSADSPDSGSSGTPSWLNALGAPSGVQPGPTPAQAWAPALVALWAVSGPGTTFSAMAPAEPLAAPSPPPTPPAQPHPSSLNIQKH